MLPSEFCIPLKCFLNEGWKRKLVTSDNHFEPPCSFILTVVQRLRALFLPRKKKKKKNNLACVSSYLEKNRQVQPCRYSKYLILCVYDHKIRCHCLSWLIIHSNCILFSSPILDYRAFSTFNADRWVSISSMVE